MFEGVPTEEKDPRKSLHIDEVAIPPLGPNEVLIAPMASALNFNTVWTSIFEPMSTFGFLSGSAARASSVPATTCRTTSSGPTPRASWCGSGRGRDPLEGRRPGDRPLQLRGHGGPEGHDDSMIDSRQRIWGFETNFGGMAELSMVKANQLMPMPTHLTWEEAACLG
jgi:crotonyl-CoA reductase